MASDNPFIEKAKREENPFERKARTKAERRERQLKLARRNHEELSKLFGRFTDDDDPDTRERVRRRVAEAAQAVKDYL